MFKMENNEKNQMSNKKLFWYGFMAEVKKLFGAILFLIGIYLGVNFKSWIIFFIFLAISIYFIAKGFSQRFDYKMRSGLLLHKGDWR